MRWWTAVDPAVPQPWIFEEAAGRCAGRSGHRLSHFPGRGKPKVNRAPFRAGAAESQEEYRRILQPSDARFALAHLHGAPHRYPASAAGNGARINPTNTGPTHELVKPRFLAFVRPIAFPYGGIGRSAGGDVRSAILPSAGAHSGRRSAMPRTTGSGPSRTRRARAPGYVGTADTAGHRRTPPDIGHDPRCVTTEPGPGAVGDRATGRQRHQRSDGDERGEQREVRLSPGVVRSPAQQNLLNALGTSPAQSKHLPTDDREVASTVSQNLRRQVRPIGSTG